MMPRFKPLLLIGLAVMVAACGGQVAQPTPTAPVPPTATTAAPPTAVAAPTSPSGLAVTPAGVASPPKLDPDGMCKAASAPGPVPNFSMTLPTDQSRGPEQAKLALYEYSDFQ